MTKLEQVARAIEVALLEHHASSSEVRAVAAARAAVEALRQPNDVMIGAACDEGYDASPAMIRSAILDWHAMVDAILSEKPE